MAREVNHNEVSSRVPASIPAVSLHEEKGVQRLQQKLDSSTNLNSGYKALHQSPVELHTPSEALHSARPIAFWNIHIAETELWV